MNTIVYNKQTGDIIALVYPGQDLQSVKSNWANIELETIEIDPNIKLLNKIKRLQYRVDLNTKELISA
jgi:hypothetical protein